MSQNIIAKEAQALQLASDEALVTLFEFTGFNSTLYFHAENTHENIYWNNNAYEAFPMVVDGIEKHADGAAARPTLIIPNVESLFKSAGSKFDTDGVTGTNSFVIEDLLGKRIVIRKTLSKYVSESTDTNENPFEFPKAEYIIDRIAQKTSLSITIELASPFELVNVKVPSRVVTGKYCPWVYQGWALGNTDVRSACHWSTKVSGTTYNSTTGAEVEITNVHLFFTIDDEPLIHTSLVSGTPSTWAGGDSFSRDVLVSHDSMYWQSLSDDNLGNTPTDNNANWRAVRVYDTYSASHPYTANATDVRRSDYTFELVNGVPVIFKCIRDNTGKTPSQNPGFWVRADVCGKLLSSCKSRYQTTNIVYVNLGNILNPVSITVGGVTTIHGAPTSIFNTAIPLPFGGFPGTRSFR